MTKNQRFLILFIVITAWFAVMGQYYLILVNGRGTVWEITVRFFSFFTILTNLLVAVCFTFLLAVRGNNWFHRPGTLTALSVYILVVGLVYNAVLRFIWEPRGWQMVVDELLHTGIPLLVQAYWLVYVPKGKLGPKNIFLWLVYPAAYCAYIMIRGSMVNEYPYPFVNVNVLGPGRVTFNCLMLCGVFYGLFLVIWR